MSSREVGKVKWFNNQKGYGFIESETRGIDLFVHHSDIEASGYRTLQENQVVEFVVVEGAKGLAAREVVALD